MDAESEKAGVDLGELLRLAKEASPLPWRLERPRINWRIMSGENYVAEAAAPRTREEDAAYIVAACNAVPELVSRIRKVHGMIESSNATLEQAIVERDQYLARIAELESLVRSLSERCEGQSRLLSKQAAKPGEN